MYICHKMTCTAQLPSVWTFAQPWTRCTASSKKTLTFPLVKYYKNVMDSYLIKSLQSNYSYCSFVVLYCCYITSNQITVVSYFVTVTAQNRGTWRKWCFIEATVWKFSPCVTFWPGTKRPAKLWIQIFCRAINLNKCLRLLTFKNH